MTVQRRTVLAAVLGRGDHPTAEQIHEEVVGRIAGVSRTTVYRVLDMLVRFGIITKACHPGAMARFDGNTERHHHLVCLHCDNVIDLGDTRLDNLKLPDTRHLGFEITDFRVQLYGVCADCGNNATAAASRPDADETRLTSSAKKDKRKPPVTRKRKKKP